MQCFFVFFIFRFGWLVKNRFLLLLLLLTLTSHSLYCLALPRVLEHVVAETKCFAPLMLFVNAHDQFVNANDQGRPFF